MKEFYLLAVLLFFKLSFTQAQLTVTLPAAADNTIYQLPASNSNALGENFFSGTNGGGSPRRGLLRFDLTSAVPPNALITSVRLQLNCNLSRSITDGVSLHKVLAAWGEGTSNAGSSGDGQGIAATVNDATWTSRFFPGTAWTSPGGDYVSTASATVSINGTGFFQWSSAAMVADVQGWLSAPASNHGWVLICNESAISTARKFASRENATPANRPSLSITYSLALPVNLTYFRAVQEGRKLVLRWQTSQELNNSHFTILHSLDGASFSEIGKLSGHGTSTAKHDYSFTHNAATAGRHFYRLLQVDYNGRQQFSAIEQLELTDQNVNLLVSPNPVRERLSVILFPELQKVSYRIFQGSGTLLLSGETTRLIDVSRLPSGLYFLHLYAKGEVVGRSPFVKIQ